MAKVNATAQIVVNITKEDALNVLIEEFGLERIFNPKENEYWNLEEEKLCRYEDTAYHGRCNFKHDIDSDITNIDILTAYKAIKELQLLLKK